MDKSCGKNYNETNCRNLGKKKKEKEKNKSGIIAVVKRKIPEYEKCLGGTKPTELGNWFNVEIEKRNPG